MEFRSLYSIKLHHKYVIQLKPLDGGLVKRVLILHKRDMEEHMQENHNM